MSNFSDNVAVLKAHEKCCRFATLQLEHLRVHRRVMHFGIKSVAEVVPERRNVQEKCTGRCTSSRGFVQKNGDMSFFCGRCNTGVAFLLGRHWAPAGDGNSYQSQYGFMTDPGVRQSRPQDLRLKKITLDISASYFFSGLSLVAM